MNQYLGKALATLFVSIAFVLLGKPAQETDHIIALLIIFLLVIDAIW